MADTFDEEEVQKRRDERQRRLAERHKGDLRRILTSKEGRRFVWRVISEGRPFVSAFNPNGLVMANRTGQQDIALAVMRWLFDAQPEAFVQMQSEAASDKLQQDVDLTSEEDNDNG